MNYWEGPARWINTILLVIVGFIGFDTLFELLTANEDNVLVGFTQDVAGLFLAPFQGMFPEQEYLLTALIGVLGYSLLAGIALAITRSVQASRTARDTTVYRETSRPAAPRPAQPRKDDTPGDGRGDGRPDRTQRL